METDLEGRLLSLDELDSVHLDSACVVQPFDFDDCHFDLSLVPIPPTLVSTASANCDPRLTWTSR